MDDVRMPATGPGLDPEAIEAWNRWYEETGRHLDFYGSLVDGPGSDEPEAGSQAQDPAYARWDRWIAENGMPLDHLRRRARDVPSE